MKANAPEKIYVHWSKHVKRLCASAAQGEGDIEYVRSDAFVKRACEWLENNLQGIVGGSIYIEDFRKYMKGE